MNSTVTHDANRHQFELEVDGRTVGHLAYSRRGDLWSLNSTQVDPSVGGQGLGTQLVLHALRTVRDEGGRVDPVCPFVPRVIEEHPEFRTLVASG